MELYYKLESEKQPYISEMVRTDAAKPFLKHLSVNSAHL